MDSKALAELVTQPEGQLTEFKREWYDLASARGKAKLARDVIAMANGLDEGLVGHIVIGREDPDRGGEIVGIQEPPKSEQVTEILSKHAQPVPSVTLFPSVSLGDKALSVIEVRWSKYHPERLRGTG